MVAVRLLSFAWPGGLVRLADWRRRFESVGKSAMVGDVAVGLSGCLRLVHLVCRSREVMLPVFLQSVF